MNSLNSWIVTLICIAVNSKMKDGKIEHMTLLS